MATRVVFRCKERKCDAIMSIRGYRTCRRVAHRRSGRLLQGLKAQGLGLRWFGFEAESGLGEESVDEGIRVPALSPPMMARRSLRTESPRRSWPEGYGKGPLQYQAPEPAGRPHLGVPRHPAARRSHGAGDGGPYDAVPLLQALWWHPAHARPGALLAPRNRHPIGATIAPDRPAFAVIETRSRAIGQ
jgi:hypothetical protein